MPSSSSRSPAEHLLCYACLWGLIKLLETGIFQDFFSGGDSRGTFNSFASSLPKVCGAMGLGFWLWTLCFVCAQRAKQQRGRPERHGSEIAEQEQPLIAGRKPQAFAELFPGEKIFLPALLLSQVLGIAVVLSSAPLVWDYQYAFGLLELSLATILGIGI